MANPYGMTELDFPGVFGAAQAYNTARSQQMLIQQQIEAAERQADRDVQIRGIMARAAGGPASGQSGGAKDAYTSAPAPPAAVQLPPSAGGNVNVPRFAPSTSSPAPAQAQAQASAPNFRRFIPDLLAAGLDPSQITALAQLDDSQSAAVTGRLQAVAPLYVQAAQLPYEQRRAFISSVRPQLLQLGIAPEEVDNFDPTDANLNAHIALGTTMTQALEERRPRLRNIQPGDDVLDERTNQIVARSPVVRGANNELFPNPLPPVTPQAPGQPRRRTAINPQTGERITLRYDEQTRQWVPEPATTPTAASPDLQNWRGAGSGPQGFR